LVFLLPRLINITYTIRNHLSTNSTTTTTMASRVNVDALSSASYMGRSGAQSLIDGILYNSRQQAAEARAAKKAAASASTDTDAASVSSFSSTSKLLPSKDGKSKDAKSKKLNGTEFDAQKLKDQALKSQIRIGI
jgi:hypothetical protein